MLSVHFAAGTAADEFSECRTGADLDQAIAACTKLIDSGGGYFDPSTAPKSLVAGTRGPQIGALQLFLSRSGYAVGNFDGVYGPATRSATTKARRALRLSAQELILHSMRELSLSLAHYTRGTLHLGQGHNGRAISDFDETLKRNPGFVAAYAVRGVAYANAGQLGRALDDYDEAIRIDPYIAETYVDRADARLALDQIGEAIADYDRAIELDPKSAEAYAGRAEARVKKKDYARAIADSNQAILLDPDSAAGYYNRALGYAGNGDLVSATIDLRVILRLFPNQPVWRDRASAQIARIRELQAASVKAVAAAATATPPTIVSRGGIVVKVSSAVINSEPITQLWVEGTISKGDETVFEEALLAGDGDTPIVFLDKLQGDVATAVTIGRLIRANKLATGVIGGSSCISACALVWLAGQTRFAEPGVSIGFQPLGNADGPADERDALITDYLAELGVGSVAISHMTEREGGQTWWLGPLEALRFGIFYEEWDYILQPASEIAG